MDTDDLDGIAENLRRIAGFEVLQKSEIKELSKITKRISFKKKELICEQGQLPAYFFGIQSGLVRLFMVSKSGIEITVNLIRSCQFFNSLVLSDNMPHYWSAITLEDSEILRIRGDDYYTFVKSHPIYAIRLLQINGNHLRVAYERVQDAFAAAASQRIAGSLCMLYCRFGPTIRITNAQLADLSGSTTATTIRVVKQFREMGLVSTRRGMIFVRNVAGIEAQSGRDLASLDNFPQNCFD